MRWLIICVCIFLCMGCQTAKWDKTELAMEAGFLTLHGIDWAQSLKIARNPGEYHEHNPLLGKHPSEGNVNMVMGAWTVIQPVIAHLLPSNWRKGFIAASGLVKLGAVINNASIGLGWGF